MKWLLFTGACVASLVALGVMAVDERDVQWEERKAFCPNCRAELAYYTHVCKACTKALDWTPRKETCRWCLGAEDVEHLRNGFTALELDEEPLPEALSDFSLAYLTVVGEGACGLCGGLGQVVKEGVELDCSVCRGDGRCVACAGSRRVLVGDEAAHRRHLERKNAWEQALDRERLTRLPLRRGMLVDEDVKALRGTHHAEWIEDEQGEPILAQARGKLARAFKAIENAHRQLRDADEPEATPPADRDGS